MPKNTKTLPRTFATFSPHGCSSVASGFARAYLRSRAFAALTVVMSDRPLLREVAVEDDGRPQLAVRHAGVARDHAGTRPTQLEVERLCLALGDRVEHQERASFRKRDPLDLAHQSA